MGKLDAALYGAVLRFVLFSEFRISWPAIREAFRSSLNSLNVSLNIILSSSNLRETRQYRYFVLWATWILSKVGNLGDNRIEAVSSGDADALC